MKTVKIVLLSTVFLMSGLIFYTGLKSTFPYKSRNQSSIGQMPTNVPSATSTALPTNIPTATVTPTSTPFFDTVYPLRIEGNNGNVIDFLSIEKVSILFNQEVTNGGVQIYDSEGDNFEHQLGGCGGANLVISNARDGENYATYKTLIYAHSGTCKNGRIMPFESIRAYIEGPFYKPNAEQRNEKIQQIVGQVICFDEACFTIVDAVYITRAEIEDYGYVDGKVDWYFPSGQIPDTQEIFLGFCGSEGGLPSQWFSAKYYLRLQRTE